MAITLGQTPLPILFAWVRTGSDRSRPRARRSSRSSSGAACPLPWQRRTVPAVAAAPRFSPHRARPCADATCSGLGGFALVRCAAARSAILGSTSPHHPGKAANSLSSGSEQVYVCEANKDGRTRSDSSKKVCPN